MASREEGVQDSTESRMNSGDSPFSPAHKDWMSHLPVELRIVPLHRLAIPGSHNSGTYSCEVTSGLSPDAAGFVKNVMRVPGFSGNALLSIVQGWAICQNLDITEQLTAGVRYFDLRISTKKRSDKLFIVHSLYASEIGEIVQEMNSFLNEHPKEVVLLDFNHFHAMDTEHHIVLVTLLLSVFGSKVCGKCRLEDLTLKHLWEGGKQVIIFYHNSEGHQFEEIWPGYGIDSFWPNTNKASNCISKLTEYHAQPRPGFFVSQGILTPTLENILKNLFTGNLFSLNKQLTPSLHSWIRESPSTCVHPPNIIIADYVHEGNFIDHVLNLNKHRIPK